MVLHFDLVGHQVSLAESIAHDCDQHVQKMDQQGELGQQVQSAKVHILGPVAQREPDSAPSANRDIPHKKE